MHTHAKTLVIGISGGLDSTLALLVAVKTCDYLGLNRKTVLGRNNARLWHDRQNI